MYVWRVWVHNNLTEQDEYIYALGNTNEEATHKLCGAGLFGAKGLYTWKGTGPVYENNDRVKWEAK
jgi:hypothetical protein